VLPGTSLTGAVPTARYGASRPE